MMGGDWFWGHMGFGWLFWLVIIGIIIWGISMMSRSRGTTEPPAKKETPLEILKKRYARGEITREEYEQMKRDLTED
ncbi:MAG: SHOCT domain-containing protein [Calditrichaeota bacterium]|nr:SHOCT domain-containing protein [Calditrichota bacterium]